MMEKATPLLHPEVDRLLRVHEAERVHDELEKKSQWPKWSAEESQLFELIARDHFGIDRFTPITTDVTSGQSAAELWDNHVDSVATVLREVRLRRGGDYDLESHIPERNERATAMEVWRLWRRFFQELIPVTDLELAARHHKFLEERGPHPEAGLLEVPATAAAMRKQKIFTTRAEAKQLVSYPRGDFSSLGF